MHYSFLTNVKDEKGLPIPERKECEKILEIARDLFYEYVGRKVYFDKIRDCMLKRGIVIKDPRGVLELYALLREKGEDLRCSQCRTNDRYFKFFIERKSDLQPESNQDLRKLKLKLLVLVVFFILLIITGITFFILKTNEGFFVLEEWIRCQPVSNLF